MRKPRQDLGHLPQELSLLAIAGERDGVPRRVATGDDRCDFDDFLDAKQDRDDRTAAILANSIGETGARAGMPLSAPTS